MKNKGGTSKIDCDEVIEIIDDIRRSLDSLGRIIADGMTSEPTSSSEEKEEKEAMVLDNLDISGIEWTRSNRAGGGPATPEDGWAWAFAYTKDGGIRPETAQLVMALERYGRVRVGANVIELSGRDDTLLSRKKV